MKKWHTIPSQCFPWHLIGILFQALSIKNCYIPYATWCSCVIIMQSHTFPETSFIPPLPLFSGWVWHHEYLAPLPLPTFPPQVGSLLLDGISLLLSRGPLHCYSTANAAVARHTQDSAWLWTSLWHHPGDRREKVDIIIVVETSPWSQWWR